MPAPVDGDCAEDYIEDDYDDEPEDDDRTDTDLQDGEYFAEADGGPPTETLAAITEEHTSVAETEDAGGNIGFYRPQSGVKVVEHIPFYKPQGDSGEYVVGIIAVYRPQGDYGVDVVERIFIYASRRFW